MRAKFIKFTVFSKSFAAALLLIFFVSCKGTNSSFSVKSDNVSYTGSNNGAKIINGSDQDAFLTPQILRIDINFTDGSKGFCTGTVIGADSILTVGHCFKGGVSSASVIKPGGEVLAVAGVFIHPQYFADQSLGAIFNDVAVIKTAQPLNLPVLGILVSTQLTVPALVDIDGYGFDENGDAGTLKRGSMLVDTVTPNHLIAVFDDLSNACNGDSGGPATFSVFDEGGSLQSVSLVGLISSGSVENCAAGDRNLFTNLNNPSVLNFISAIVPEVALQ